MNVDKVSVEEVVKAAENSGRIIGWVKFLLKKLKVISVLFLCLPLLSCAKLIKIIAELPIPPAPTDVPSTPVPTALPTLEPTSTPTATPSPSSSPSPTPIQGGIKKPVVAFWKVGGLHQDISQYRCQNPQDGPKFQNGNICNVGSTTYLTCNPEVEPGCDQKQQGPCDPDHQNTFCYGRFDWDDARGPLVIVDGAQDFEVDPENSYNTLVHFYPGKAFRICTAARLDYHTSDGIYLEALPNTQTCTEHRYK